MKDIFGNDIITQPAKPQKKLTKGTQKAESPAPVQKDAVQAPPLAKAPKFEKPEITERHDADMIKLAELMAFQAAPTPNAQPAVERLFYVSGNEITKQRIEAVSAYDGDQAMSIAAAKWPTVRWYSSMPVVGSVPVVHDNFYRVLGWYQVMHTLSDIQLMAFAHIFCTDHASSMQDQLELYAKQNGLYATEQQKELIQYIRKAYELNTGTIHPDDIAEHSQVGFKVIDPDQMPF